MRHVRGKLLSSLRPGQARKKTRLTPDPTTARRRLAPRRNIATYQTGRVVLPAYDPLVSVPFVLGLAQYTIVQLRRVR